MALAFNMKKICNIRFKFKLNLYDILMNKNTKYFL